MFRFIFDRDGKNEMDVPVGYSNINIGMQDDNFEAAETAFIFDGTSLESYKGVETCVASRKVGAVLT